MKDFDGEYRTKTVIKGISMNSSNQKIACFDKVLEKVEAYVNDFDTSTSVFYDTNIHFYRSPEFRIFMVNLQKRYKICYDKRVICADFSTIPYGYTVIGLYLRLKGCCEGVEWIQVNEWTILALFYNYNIFCFINLCILLPLFKDRPYF